MSGVREALEAAIRSRLNLTRSEVAEIRARQEREDEEEGKPYTLAIQQMHPAQSSTPLNKSVAAARQRAYKVRHKSEPILVQALAGLIAEDIAERDVEAIEKARDDHATAEWKRVTTGLHQHTRDFIDRLFAHGVRPNHLKHVGWAEAAILGDLIRWKENDPSFKDPDNPWLALRAIYSGRLVLNPADSVDVKLSVPGTPKRAVRYTDPKHYLFQLMPGEQARSTARVCEIEALQDEEDEATAVEDTDDRSAEEASQEVLPEPIRTAPEEAAEPVGEHVRDDAAASERLRVKVDANLEVLAPDWACDLEAAGFSADDPFKLAMLERVESYAAQHPDKQAVARFVAAARQDGVDAAYRQHREAAVNEIVEEMLLTRTRTG